MRKRLLLLIVTSLLSIYFAFLYYEGPKALKLSQHLGYYITGGCVLIWAALFYFNFKEYFKLQHLKQFKVYFPALVILGLTAVVFTSEKQEFKVVMDEPNLLGTSMSMHFGRMSFTPVRAQEAHGHYFIFNGFVDKRPILFPFLVSLVHDISGYRIENGFYLNMALTPAFLGVIYLLGYWLGGMSIGLSGVFLVSCVPIITANFAGAGFELLNALMIVAAMLSGIYYLRAPNTLRFNFFVYTSLLMCQIRYETVVYLLPLVVIMMVGWWKSKNVLANPITYIAPFFLLPYAWILHAFKENKGFWQLEDIKQADVPFSLKYIPDNLERALFFFFENDLSMSGSQMVSIAGSIGLIFLTVRILRKWVRREQFSEKELLLSLFFMGFVVGFIFMMSYFYAIFDNLIIRRLSIPTYLGLIMLAMWAANEGLEALNLKKRYAFLGALLYFWGFGLYGTSNGLHDDVYTAGTEFNWLCKAAEKYHDPDKRPYFISNMNLAFLLTKKDTCNITYSDSFPDQLKEYLDSPFKPDIYVHYTEGFNTETLAWEPMKNEEHHKPNEKFVLEPLEYAYFSLKHRAVIYKLVAINDIEIKEPTLPQENNFKDHKWMFKILP